MTLVIPVYTVCVSSSINTALKVLATALSNCLPIMSCSLLKFRILRRIQLSRHTTSTVVPLVFSIPSIRNKDCLHLVRHRFT